MTPVPISSEILGAMITPAVLISACGVLVLSTSNRVGRTVDRVRSLAAEVERLQMSPESISTPSQKISSRRQHVADQLAQLSKRAVLLRSAMTALYSAIGLLVGTSILVGIVALLQWQYSSMPVVVGFAGACALLYATLLLVREARLALFTTVEEVAFAREAALRGEEQKKVKREESRKI
jgi:Flp pilus assembly protein TadB